MAKYQMLIDLDDGTTQIYKILGDKKWLLLEEFPTREEAEAYIQSLPRDPAVAEPSEISYDPENPSR